MTNLPMVRTWILITLIGLGTALLLWTLSRSDRSVLAWSDRQSQPTVTQPVSTDDLNQRWIVNASEATYLLEAGAILLDARGLSTSLTQHLKGAISVNWQDFSQSDSAQRGKLIADISLLEEKIGALGISNDAPVVVFSDPVRGWGEDGRIVWMLRSLGHNQTVMVDGGIRALIQAGIPATGIFPSSASPEPGTFRAQLSDRWHIERDAVQQQLNDEQTTLIDTREPREYQGQTPYGEQRGGHLPGAIHVYFKEFLASDGTLLPPNELMQLLHNRGITRDKTVIAYCTGGVRSAWVTAVLHDLGYSVRNYAGSTWEWSASSEHAYPLETLN